MCERDVKWILFLNKVCYRAHPRQRWWWRRSSCKVSMYEDMMSEKFQKTPGYDMIYEVMMWISCCGLHHGVRYGLQRHITQVSLDRCTQEEDPGCCYETALGPVSLHIHEGGRRDGSRMCLHDGGWTLRCFHVDGGLWLWRCSKMVGDGIWFIYLCDFIFTDISIFYSCVEEVCRSTFMFYDRMIVSGEPYNKVLIRALSMLWRMRMSAQWGAKYWGASMKCSMRSNELRCENRHKMILRYFYILYFKK